MSQEKKSLGPEFWCIPLLAWCPDILSDASCWVNQLDAHRNAECLALVLLLCYACLLLLSFKAKRFLDIEIQIRNPHCKYPLLTAKLLVSMAIFSPCIFILEFPSWDELFPSFVQIFKNRSTCKIHEDWRGWLHAMLC